MGYQLVALDIDGTLLNNQQELSPRVRRAIKQAQERGIDFTLATGRPWRRTSPWARALQIRLPVAVHNGAVIVDPTTEKVLLQQGIPKPYFQELLTQLRQEDITHVVYTGESSGDEVVMEESLWQRSRHLVLKYIGDTITPVENLRISQSPIRIAVIEESSRLQQFLAEWRRDYGDRLNMIVFGTPQDKHMGVEFINKNCSKASGVEYALKQEGLCFSEVIAIGDDFNDKELITRAGYGVAMLNAPHEIRKIAKYVTGSNQDDGVAQLLEEMLLAL